MTNQISKSVSEWYFDKNTFLPVGYIGNGGLTIKEIEIIKINKIKVNDFDINNDLIIQEKVITGMEPNIKNLPLVGEKFPNFKLKDFNNNWFNNTVFEKNSIIIIDFWSTWCGPCIKAMSELQELYNKYNSKGLNIIGISVYVSPKNHRHLLKTKDFPIIF